jgi:hypothetical protein
LIFAFVTISKSSVPSAVFSENYLRYLCHKITLCYWNPRRRGTVFLLLPSTHFRVVVSVFGKFPSYLWQLYTTLYVLCTFWAMLGRSRVDHHILRLQYLTEMAIVLTAS